MNSTSCVNMRSDSGKWYAADCSTAMGFVCRDVNTLGDQAPAYSPDDVADVDGPCPEQPNKNSWLTIGSDCYYVNTTIARPFGLQTTNCLSISPTTHIASVSSQLVNDRLVGKIQEQQKATNRYLDTWIGYMQAGGTFEAIDGSPVSFVNWENGIIPDMTGVKDPQCVFIDSQTGYWLLRSCTSSLGVVCKQPKSIFLPHINSH